MDSFTSCHMFKDDEIIECIFEHGLKKKEDYVINVGH